MTKKAILLAVGTLALVPFLMGASCGADDKDDNTLTFLLLVNQLLNPAFTASCTVGTSACLNSYGSAPSGCTGSTSTTKCTATNAYGACKSVSGTTRTELVYYPGNSVCASAAACETNCKSLASSWNSNYTGN